MKHKLTRRLILHFALVLTLFALVVGALFAGIFAHHSAEIHAQDLQAHAVSISDTITQFVVSSESGACKGGGFNAYFRYIAAVARSDIWLLDEALNPMHLGDQSSFMTELPASLAPYVPQVFDSRSVCRFPLEDAADLTDMVVGAPVFGADGAVRYALLVRHPVAGVSRAYYDALRTLVLCLVCAFALSVLLSVLLSRRFIRPIGEMTRTTQKMMDGDYAVSTGVRQGDELGMLARHIDALSVRLLDAQQAQQETDANRRAFFSNVSHELRTPLSVLKGSLEVLSEGMITDPGEVQAYLSQMLCDANHMERLVGDLLELSRLQDSQFTIDKEPLNLSDVAAETVHFMRQKASAKQITLSLAGDLAPFRALGDYGRLRQMLIILIDNAIKFSPEGSEIRLTVTQSPSSCAISVADHGVGISETDLPHIFDRFYLNRSALNRSGNGLGLPIAKEIALRHDIDMRCESRLGEGSCFTLVIPAYRE